MEDQEYMDPPPPQPVPEAEPKSGIVYKIKTIALKLYQKRKDKKLAKKAKEEAEDDDAREGWDGKYSFFLAALGYAVGLSCVWRFPALAYQDGGGAFLIPFIIFSFVLGIPLVFLELSVGQYTSVGTLSCWTMSRCFRGVGIAMNFSNAYVTIYYNMLIAYAIYYLFKSFTSTLPWKYCSKPWASPSCVDDFSPESFTFTDCLNNVTDFQCLNGRCLNQSMFSAPITNPNGIECNYTNASYFSGWYNPSFPAADYWTNVILEQTDSIENSGGLVWQLVLVLMAAWAFTYLMVVKGVEGTGKIVYITTTMPFVVLFILGVKGWTLPGAGVGLSYFLTPKISHLSNIGVWSDAAIQVFFTLSISYGGLLTYASYNKFNAPILRDSIILSVLSCVTSIFCGFVIFPYIGYLSVTTGMAIENVIQSDSGLAFVVFPYAVSQMAGSPFWSILFFIVILVIGLDNMMASVETSTCAISDLIPSLKKTKFRKFCVTTGIVVFNFLIGLLFCQRSGTYWVTLFNQYSGGWSVLFTATVECLSVAFFYGFDNYRGDIFVMVGHKVAYSPWFNIYRISWLFICPAIFIFLMIYGWATFQRLSYNDYIFPIWADVLGNLMCALTVSGIFIYMAYDFVDVIRKKRTLKSMIQPAPSWIPLRLPDRVFANVVKFEDKYVKYDIEDVYKGDKDTKKDATGPIPDTNLPVEIFNVRLPSDSNQDISLEPENRNAAVQAPFYIGSMEEDLNTVTKL